MNIDELYDQNKAVIGFDIERDVCIGRFKEKNFDIPLTQELMDNCEKVRTSFGMLTVCDMSYIDSLKL